MRIERAQKYLSADISSMTLNELQKHRVHLLDAWRESRAEFGVVQAINDGFYKLLPEMGVSSATPSDFWLTKNISSRLDEVENRLNKMLR